MAALPDYGKPPVVEVAMGVQFSPLADFTVGHVGLYWSTIRDAFSRVEEHAPISHIVEPPPDTPEGGISLQLMDRPDLPRAWFSDASGSRLIQIQRDRFLHNWRKVNPVDDYPRFPSVKETFFNRWQAFNRFLTENNISEPQPDQCDLIYVNHVTKGEIWSTMTELENVFTTFKWRTRSGFLPGPDNARWSLRFLLPDNKGRLHVEVVPVRVPPQNDPVIRFSLTARGRPQGEFNLENMNDWFVTAHEWIVRGFSDLVNTTTDTIWEKRT